MTDKRIETEKYIKKPFFIGNVKADNNVFLAPMAGVADRAFRTLCKSRGAGLVYSEMISAKGVHYNSENSIVLADTDDREFPCAVQIFGSEPEIMAEAAVLFEAKGAPMLDINMGCPVPKVAGNGEGSALMKNPELAGRIVKAVSSAVNVPVTVKMRRGFELGNESALELASVVCENGAAAVAVHGRFREEYYSGKCDLDIIKKVKNAVSVPVIASGDICSAADAARMFEYTGCDAIMIGRAALGNPWIFEDILSGEDKGRRCGEEILNEICRQAELTVEFKGEDVGVRELRKHIAWYLKGLPGSAAVKDRVFKCTEYNEIIGVLSEYLGAKA
ncbi:MAG: tRNA dihydrouridine synthase DusB [Clostridia bacterium]|nr:tRNA dihydrouridine synthase DusB [Clostridia bacterium]